MSIKKQHLWIDRKYRRATVNIPCKVGKPAGGSSQATITNLSAGGLRITCNQETYERLLPEELRTPGMINGIPISISFAIDSQDRKHPYTLTARAQIIHSERLAQDTYHVGVQFEELEQTDDSRLAAYIDMALAEEGQT